MPSSEGEKAEPKEPTVLVLVLLLLQHRATGSQGRSPGEGGCQSMRHQENRMNKKELGRHKFFKTGLPTFKRFLNCFTTCDG